MTYYETLILTVPEITNNEAQELESTLSKVIGAAKGTLVSFDRWGKYRLAYPVRKNDYGVYFLARFTAADDVTLASLVKEVDTLLAIKFNTFVARHTINVLDSKKGLEYTKPESLDETPRDVETFLKENKMEGLLKDNEQSVGEYLDEEPSHD